MKKIIAILALAVCLINCSKKKTEPAKVPSASFTFTDKNRTNISDTSIDCNCRFSLVAGGNSSLDTSHGYVFSYYTQRPIHLSFEIPQLTSGTYSYVAFSPSWPWALYYDQWMEKDQTFSYTNTAKITINISRYSNGSLDGTFSLSFNDPSSGGSFVNITNGKLLNVPVK